jgi:hypothetical protein
MPVPWRTPEAITALGDELRNDPAGLGYAPLLALGADEALAKLLNLRGRPGRRPVTVRGLLRWGATSGVLSDLVTSSQGASSRAARAVSLAFLRLLDRLDSLDLDDADIRAMVDALVLAGVLTAAQRTELMALGAAQVSRAEELFGPGTSVGHLDVAQALGRG